MNSRRLTFAVLVGLFGAGAAARAVDLESANLKLSVTTGPSLFSFQLLDKTNGNAVVLTQSSTLFGSNGVTGVSSTTTGNDGLHDYINLTFSLAGGSTAMGRFTLLSPQVVRVDLTGPASTATIKQLFTDSGEHYYGTYQQTYGKTLDNRGLTKAYHGAFETVDEVGSEGARAPFYFTNKNAGVYVETTNVGTFQLGVSSAGGFNFNTTANALRYDMIVGSTPKGVLQQFNTLAAPSFMPPTWALDSIWWRDDQHQIPVQSGAANAQALVLADADKLRQLHIPSGAIWIDRPYGTSTGNTGSGTVANWGNMDFDSAFPNPAQMVTDLDARGMNLLLWIANRANQNLLTEGTANGYLVTGTSNPNPAIDVNNPAAYAWFKNKLNTFVNLGIKGYKIDRGGEGEMPDSMSNNLPYLFDKLAYEGMATANGADFFNFARDPADKSRQYSAVWNGDSVSNFTGLASSVKNGIRAGLINYPIYGSDTGGYQVGVPTKELFARWLEFSAYCPLMEVLNGPSRNVWYDYDQQLIDIAVKQTQDHHDLIPYVRSQIYQATQNGTPVIRALILDYPTDANVIDEGDEYLYGPNILVAPVLTAGATSRSVYLPAGRWVDYNGKSTVFSGGQTITASAALDTIPLYAREGAIIPRGDIVLNNQASWKPNWSPSLHVEFFPSATVPASFDYFTGSGVQTINSSMSGNDVHVSFGDPGTPGTLELYLGRFYTLTSVQQVFLNSTLLAPNAYTLNGQNLLTVPYSGATTLDVIGLTQWNSASNGNWSTAGNWNTGAAPTGKSAIVNFGPTIQTARTVTVDTPRTLGTMNFTSTGTYTITGAGGLTLHTIAGAAAINVITGSHVISTDLALNDDTNIAVAANQKLSLGGRVTGAGLNLTSGKVVVTPQTGTSLSIKSLSIAPGALLDLTSNAMLIDIDAPANIRAELQSGRLFSSSADTAHGLGYADIGGDLLVKYAYFGDTNLDMRVDIMDVYNLALHFNGGGYWSDGDFDYNGVVNAIDLGMLSRNWQAGTGALLSEAFGEALSQVDSVPEPMMGLSPLATVLLRRRRRCDSQKIT